MLGQITTMGGIYLFFQFHLKKRARTAGAFPYLAFGASNTSQYLHNSALSFDLARLRHCEAVKHCIVGHGWFAHCNGRVVTYTVFSYPYNTYEQWVYQGCELLSRVS